MQVWRINFLSYSDKKTQFSNVIHFYTYWFHMLNLLSNDEKQRNLSLSLSLLKDLERDTENSFWPLVVSSCSMLRFASTWAQ